MSFKRGTKDVNYISNRLISNQIASEKIFLTPVDPWVAVSGQDLPFIRSDGTNVRHMGGIVRVPSIVGAGSKMLNWPTGNYKPLDPGLQIVLQDIGGETLIAIALRFLEDGIYTNSTIQANYKFNFLGVIYLSEVG